MVDCCRPNPPCVNFCRLDGHLLKGKGVITNPDNGHGYEVLRVLAEGGMSTTYLVYNYAIGRLSVLKEIDSELTAVAKVRELFQREARILKSLSHQGIPQFYDFFASKNYYSLIMEMVYGESLLTLCPRDEREAVGWMYQVAKILNYLHNLPQPVIHRDIKPANLILRHHPQEVVLIDFGAVKEATQKPGTHIATLGFSSPEQKKGLSFIQSDFYAVGTTLIYLLTRQSPTKFFNPVLNRFVGLDKANISPSLIEIILFLTQSNPNDRPVSAIALMDLFSQFLT